MQPWDENANNLQYNATTNWTAYGGRGIGTDVTSPIDIQNSVNGEMSWDITPLAQQALDQGQPYISIMLYAGPTAPGDLVYFQSSDFTTGQPSINMTWSYGSRDLPTNTCTSVASIGSNILQPNFACCNSDRRPTFDWQWPTSQSSVPSDWRIYFDLDPEDDMAGQLMFDSRITPSLFD